MGTWTGATNLIGEVLDGRYRILRLLGQGGMGVVYEATHVRLENRVALKILDPALAQDERQRKRFLREARAATRIRHENVVNISDFGEASSTFFVMEFLDGPDLAALLRKDGKFTWARTKPIMLQILDALQCAHRLGIVHRDMKPSNVIVLFKEAREVVKILDFGIAKVAQSDADTRGVTRTDEVIGTLAYMAPEQALALPTDGRSDVYSVGVMLFELVTGTIPFSGTSAYKILDQHVREPPPPPRSREASIPEALERAILTAMAKNPLDRFQTMAEFHAALAAIPADERSHATVRASSGSGPPVIADRGLIRMANAAPGDDMVPRTVTGPAAWREDSFAGTSRTHGRRVGLLVGIGVTFCLGVLVAAAFAYMGGREAPLPPQVASASALPPNPPPPETLPPIVDAEIIPVESSDAPLGPALLMGDKPIPDVGIPDNPVPPERPTPGQASPGNSHGEAPPPAAPATDETILRTLVRRARKQCRPSSPTTLSFQVLPSGKVMLPATLPENPCITQAAQGTKFRPRTTVSVFEQVIHP